MFTGIVSAVGRVAKATQNGGLSLVIRAPFKGVKRGESIAVNGACLTVERVAKGAFTVHVIDTTRDRTLLGEYAAGRPVNLERAVRAADRLGGHLVQGHVDGVAVVERGEEHGDAWLYDVPVPGEVWGVSIPPGPIHVDGVSLTVNALPARPPVQVSLIPFTRAHTTLGRLRVGDQVHVQADFLGKSLRHLS